MLISWMAGAALTVIAYRMGRWKKKSIVAAKQAKKDAKIVARQKRREEKALLKKQKKELRLAQGNGLDKNKQNDNIEHE